MENLIHVTYLFAFQVHWLCHYNFDTFWDSNSAHFESLIGGSHQLLCQWSKVRQTEPPPNQWILSAVIYMWLVVSKDGNCLLLCCSYQTLSQWIPSSISSHKICHYNDLSGTCNIMIPSSTPSTSSDGLLFMALLCSTRLQLVRVLQFYHMASFICMLILITLLILMTS
jgi:hypothetical protein